MSVFRHGSATPAMWPARLDNIRQDLFTLEQLVAMHKDMVASIRKLQAVPDKRVFDAWELTRSLNRMRKRIDDSLAHLAQERWDQ